MLSPVSPSNFITPHASNRPTDRLLRKQICVLGIALSFFACEEPDLRSGASTTEPQPVGGSPLSEEELTRAGDQVLNHHETVSLPDSKARLGDPTVPFLDLNGHLSSAEVTSAWTPGTSDPKTLAQVGPVSTSAPGNTAKIQETHQRVEQYRWLQISGFSIRREEVGEIVVEGEFGDAPHFALVWDKFSSLRIDTSPKEGSSRYSIKTAGLTNWEGVSRWIRVGIPDPQRTQRPAEFEIISIEFLSRTSAYEQSAGLAEAKVGRALRPSTYLHGSTSLRFEDVSFASPRRLSFGTAALNDPVHLTVSARGRGESQVLLDREVSNTTTWEEAKVDIPKELGGTFDLVFEVAGDPNALLFVGSPTLYQPRDNPPRVIVYLIDALAAGHMSLHGYERETTPNLTALAEKGVWFKNAYSNASWTKEAIPSLFLSMPSVAHGHYRSFQRLPSAFVTLPEVFSAHGFATAAFSTNINASPATGMAQGFDTFYDHLALASDPFEYRTAPIPQIVQWFEDHEDRPTFVYVHTAEPHHYYNPPPPFKSMFDPDYRGEVTGIDDRLMEQGRRGSVDPRDLEHLVALYDGELAFADQVFDQLFTTLEDRGFLRNGTVVVTSDHGEAFHEHGSFRHGINIHNEILQIPLIFWGPGDLKSGLQIGQNAQLIDVMPTLLDLFELSSDLPMEGRSWAPVLRGRGASDAEGEPILVTTFFKTPPRLALIEGDWKLIFLPSDEGRAEAQLYNLKSDRAEKTNLLETHPGVARRLLRKLVNAYRESPRYAEGYTARSEVSQEQIERLRALGYLE